jgi:hypothetical protein
MGRAMRLSKHLQMASGAILLTTSFFSTSFGQAPAAPTRTLWTFLGLPSRQTMAGALQNQNGDDPGAENTPPLKSIADPANLTEGAPGGPLQVAAKIKHDQDLAPQKIKAIKYLATVGCGCYPGVRDALLQALDDCTEEVRFQAAEALCQVAGNCCDQCGNTCCNASAMTKLQDVATGMRPDNPCCYKEASPRVRCAAEQALNACKNKVPPRPVVEPTPGPGTPIKPEQPRPIPPLSPEGLKPVIPPPPSGVPAPAPPPTVPTPATRTGGSAWHTIKSPTYADSQTGAGAAAGIMRLSAESPEPSERLQVVIGGDAAR